MIVAAVPAYNEEKTVAKVIVRALKHVDKVVVVDDGSTDDTAAIAEQLGACVVRHEANSGYGVAVRSCFEAARDLNADILVVLDADGQHSGDDIPNVLAPVKSGEAEIVVGSRFARSSAHEIRSTVVLGGGRGACRSWLPRIGDRLSMDPRVHED